MNMLLEADHDHVVVKEVFETRCYLFCFYFIIQFCK